MPKNEPSLTSMRQMVLEISQSQELEENGCHHLVGFSASFPPKYDVTHAIWQDNAKMRVQYLSSLLLDLFQIFQVFSKFCLISNVTAMATRS